MVVKGLAGRPMGNAHQPTTASSDGSHAPLTAKPVAERRGRQERECGAASKIGLAVV